VFLPTCTAEELHAFFGPVASLLVESQNGDDLVEYRIERKSLACRPLIAGVLASITQPTVSAP
jgi:hypothetical protein